MKIWGERLFLCVDPYVYIYQYTDHLGNTRLAYSDKDNSGTISTDEIIQENNYYPFGLSHRGYNNAINGRSHNLKYNNTELEEGLGLDWYEMPLRSYDPTIARWNRIDPVVHHGLSTYNSFDNNPIFYSDPSGGNSEDESTEGAVSQPLSDTEIRHMENDVVIEWGNDTNGGTIWFNNGSNNGAGHTWSFTHEEALSMFTPMNWQASGERRQSLPDVSVTYRPGDIANNILSRTRAANITMSNIYATKWYDVNYGGDGSGSFMDKFNYFVYQTDKVNPIAILWDTASYSRTGEDRRGNAMTPLQANLNAIAIVPVGRVGTVTKVGLWEVGAYNKIRGTVPGLDAHHVGQAALMERLIPNYNRKTAPSILVPKVGHTIRGPNGIVSRSTKGLTTPRQVLARDIFELRRVYPNIPNSSLQALINLNKKYYPNSFTK